MKKNEVWIKNFLLMSCNDILKMSWNIEIKMVADYADVDPWVYEYSTEFMNLQLKEETRQGKVHESQCQIIIKKHKTSLLARFETIFDDFLNLYDFWNSL